ncbi:MAG: hypothetical protein KQ78_01007 [Candidatus Izimaplasma bacterium HR2]|nr:MAG: hypothetical protein KQ78_01007 [Candidatus Izimaplasma bacterium HR2]
MYKNRVILLTALFLLSMGVVSVFALTESNDEYTLKGFYDIYPYVDSNRYTHMKSDEIAVNTQDVNLEYKAISTEIGTVYIDEESLAFQVYNNNEYLWSSTIDYSGEDISESVLYSMRSALNITSFNTNNVNYTIVREHLFTPGTVVNMDETENGFEANIIFGISKIEITMAVSFTIEGIEVEILDEDIIEEGSYKLKSIQVYKDFGSVKNDDVPGYVFIPDGIGALIDYKEDDLGVPNYQKSIYGNPLGFNKESNLYNLVQDGSRLYAPVFGFVHGVDQQGVFANIVSGGEYGNINVYYPSKNRGYMTVFPEFIYRSTYNQPIDQLGNSITLLQDDPNTVNISIMYTFLENENANYVGMAITYRDYLLSLGASYQNVLNSENIPLHLSFLASENKAGMIFTNHIQLTTIEDIINIIDTLKIELSDNIILSINGFTDDGASWEGPLYKKMDKSFGSSAELGQLNEMVESLYLISNHIMVNSTNGRYNRFTELAKKINDQIYIYQNITSEMYLLEYDVVLDNTFESLDELNHLDYDGLALSYLGSTLYGDFSNDKYINDQINIFTDLLDELDKEIALYDSNAYFFPYIDSYFDFPLYSSQFLTFDDTVPFFAIALSNVVDLYSPYANFFPQERDVLLRMIDFHVYPSFVLTEESSKKLKDTNLESIYSSKYDSLKPAVYTYYEFVNNALKYTIDATIINREVIEEGVVRVTYSNDVWIIINYTDVILVFDQHTVEPKSYLVGGTS